MKSCTLKLSLLIMYFRSIYEARAPKDHTMTMKRMTSQNEKSYAPSIRTDGRIS